MYTNTIIICSFPINKSMIFSIQIK